MMSSFLRNYTTNYSPGLEHTQTIHYTRGPWSVRIVGPANIRKEGLVAQLRVCINDISATLVGPGTEDPSK